MQLRGEERVTYEVAKILSKRNFEIISVHAPDGQGPFVIPKDSENTIDRASYFPDIVAIDKKDNKIVIFEVKEKMDDIEGDIKKIESLSESRSSLLHICFKCRELKEYKVAGIDFENVDPNNLSKVIKFGFGYTYSKDSKTVIPEKINGFECIKISIDDFSQSLEFLPIENIAEEEIENYIPLYESVSAGEGDNIAQEKPYAFIKLEDLNLKKQGGDTIFLVKVEGNSMNKKEVNHKKIEDGTHVLVRVGKIVDIGDAIIVSFNNGTAILKEYSELNGKSVFESCSTEPQKEVSIEVGEEPNIIGKVIDVFSI